VRAPSLFIASGARPPHMSGLQHDPDHQQPSISRLRDGDFWHHFERRYGCNPDLADEIVKEVVLPLLRADFGILEAYTPSRAATPLPCPVVACCAHGDNRVSPEQLMAWAALSAEGEFREVMFHTTPLPWSTPHRYLVETPGVFQRFLARECTELLCHMNAAVPKPATVAPAAATMPPPPPPPAPHAASTSMPATSTSIETSTNVAGALSLPELLAEAKCHDRAPLVHSSSVSEWVALLKRDGRPAFLKMLVSLGFEKLSERQAITNALGRAQREGRV